MVTRDLLQIVGQFRNYGKNCREIKIILKREWEEKEIDEAIWWFEYCEKIIIKKQEEYSLLQPKESARQA